MEYINANIEKQKYGIGGPLKKYLDTQIRCQKCFELFTFTKEEQQFWYETMQFYVDSTPINCTSCRRLVRRIKSAHKNIAETLTLHPSYINLISLCKSYICIQNKEKALLYLQRANKKTNKNEHLEISKNLKNEINNLEPFPEPLVLKLFDLISCFKILFSLHYEKTKIQSSIVKKVTKIVFNLTWSTVFSGFMLGCLKEKYHNPSDFIDEIFRIFYSYSTKDDDFALIQNVSPVCMSILLFYVLNSEYKNSISSTQKEQAENIIKRVNKRVLGYSIEKAILRFNLIPELKKFSYIIVQI